jgi:23S rRNA pseudouridine1911/1915/1917 synthase
LISGYLPVMPAPDYLELGRGRNALRIPILYEDRSALVIDKPAGWMLAPTDWRRTGRNLAAAILSSIRGGDFWARSRNLKFLRFVHRLDADTTGLVLFGKSRGALEAYSGLFESRLVTKTYLAVVTGKPRQEEWTCRQEIGPAAGGPGRMRIDLRHGREAETRFKVLATRGVWSLLEARPLTGRTHQIRLHLVSAGCPVVGDELYEGSRRNPARPDYPLALRAVGLAYRQPFTKAPVTIAAPAEDFKRAFGFGRGMPPGGHNAVNSLESVGNPQEGAGGLKEPR